jgi:CheY-like chemotaxis protein
MKKIQVLVVDDREENRNAAAEYFKTREDVNVDFAKTYEQAIKMLNEKVYYFGLFDLELPRKEGDAPEKLGFYLADEADKTLIPWAILTAGLGHALTEEEKKSTHACFYIEDKKHRCPQEFIKIKAGAEEIALTSKRKEQSNTWKIIFEILEDAGKEGKELAETKERILSAMGMEWIKKSLFTSYKSWIF